MGTYCVIWWAQPSALWQARGVGCGGKEEGFQEGENMYTCGWLMFMCGRGQHNIQKQLSSN